MQKKKDHFINFNDQFLKYYQGLYFEQLFSIHNITARF